MRTKTRIHRISAALCAVPFLVLVGAGAASAAPTARPAAAPSHFYPSGCDDWGRGGYCYDGYGPPDFYGNGYGVGYGPSAYVVVLYY
ncbi:hypothetical protein [Streptomyces sp. NPDC053427]|uniref:hypothetical protein n=1 Tax=Streptomyces sp. NPDC053427 TaxID=3365701 RepID=UPI0037D5EA83